ncbi:MAG: hypothetical protein ACKOBZ_00675 [Nitrospira sp.]|nr:hypothetical protein [Nitrospira sp.]
MDRAQRSQPGNTSSPDARPRRIDTQIHRRKKAKALSPLTAEWEARRSVKSTDLKMPSDRMRKAP